MDPGTHTVYVANHDDDTVSSLHVSGSWPTPTFDVDRTPLPVGKSPTEIAVNPVFAVAYVANYQSGTLSQIDAEHDQVMSPIQLDIHPQSVAVDTSTNTVYAVGDSSLDPNSGGLDVITDGQVTSTVRVAKGPQGVAVDPGSHHVFVSNNQEGSLSVMKLNGPNYEQVATSPVGANPAGVAVDPDTHLVYVANYGDESVTVVDGDDGTPKATVHVGGQPHTLAVDTATEPHKVYVTNSADNTVSVIDGSTNTAEPATIPVGRGPTGVAVDSARSTVYVANRDANTVSVIHRQ